MGSMNREATEQLIQEVLEVYPVETGKQRAKHLLANDPTLEKSNKCIVANKKALPGVMTARGCAYAGSKGVVWGPVKDVVNISHGPVGCGQFSRGGRRNYVTGHSGVTVFNDINFTSDFQEKDVVFGGDKKLAKLIDEIMVIPMTTGLFYTSDTGNTREVAKMIKRRFAEGEIKLFNFAKATADEVQNCEALIFGTPTLGDGELPEALEAFLPTLDGVDFSGKPVALFGLGDQVEYPKEFVDALGILYRKLKKLGAQPSGSWPLDGYTFEKSRAVVDGKFVGLVIDQDNQQELTEQRVNAWVEQVKPVLLEAAAVAG